MDERIQSFLEANPAAAMITLRRDNTPHVVRIGVALVDGKIWSSGTQTRVRTKHLRRDPRSTLFVFGEGYGWLGLETTVNILDGPDVPDLSLHMMQLMQAAAGQEPSAGRITWFGQQKTEAEFRQIMIEEQRLIYEFNVNRAYGMY